MVLPEELISMVFSNLSPKDDANTIHALRLSNKMLCRLATPFLYRSIKVRMLTPGNYMQAEHALKDAKLIEELMQYPERAAFVKELIVSQRHSGVVPNNAKTRKAQKKRAAEDNDDLVTTINNAVETEDRADARVAFFLCMCNNLEVLLTKLPYSILGKLPLRVLERAASEHLQLRLYPGVEVRQPQLLRSVREISIRDGNYEDSVEDVKTLLCLPSLQKLRMDGVADTRQHYDRTPLPHDGIIRNVNPISLVFDSCMLSGPGLETLLSTCPNAKELTIRWRPGLWNEHFRNQEACDVLREHGRNLEMKNPVGTFGSFAALNAKRLIVPKGFFDHLLRLPKEQKAAEAPRLLPNGLKELYILGVTKGEMAGLGAMVGVDVIPGFEKLVCVPWFSYEIEEWFGPVTNKSVDYDRVGGFELRTEGYRHKTDSRI